MQVNPFKSSVHSLVSASPIIDLLGTASAVVFERIARGGGATKWYYCPSKTHLEAIELQLSPGSVVSFYFDDRICSGIFSSELRLFIEKLVARTGEALIGTFSEDSMQINIECVNGPNDIAEFASTISPLTRVFYGEFPDRDNDGVRAVTLALPDSDGIVRAHPH